MKYPNLNLTKCNLNIRSFKTTDGLWPLGLTWDLKLHPLSIKA